MRNRTPGDKETCRGSRAGFPYLAAKEDVRKIKVRVLVGVPGGIVLAAKVVSTLLGTFLP